MSLNRASQGVQIAGPRMRCERLPCWKRIPRSLDRGIDIRSRSLGHRCDLLSGSRIARIKKNAFDRLAPCAINEMTEAPLMAVEPEQRILRVFGRRPIFHGEEFVGYAHSSRFTFFLNLNL
jgi:hypothetical protein